MSARSMLSAFLCATALAAQQPNPPLEIARTLVRTATAAEERPDALFAELLQVATEHGRSPAAALAVGNAQLLAEQVSDLPAALQALERLLAAAPHGIVELAARRLQVDLLRDLGRLADARAVRAQVGDPLELVVVGPFGDVGEEYLGVPFAPEWEFPGPGATLAGRYGDVTPRLARRQPFADSIELVERDGGRSGCHYAMLLVDCEQPVDGFVEIGARGSTELFVQDVPRGRVDRHAERGGHQLRWLPVRLGAGRNRVVVKTTSARDHSLWLRIVDAAGRPLRGAELNPELAKQIAPAAAEEPPAAEFTTPLLALARAAEAIDGADLATARVALALEASRLGESLPAVAAWAELEREPPTDPRETLALAVAARRMPLLPQEVRRSRARALLESVQEKLAGNAQVELGRASFLVDDDRGEEAIRLLEARVADGRAGPETFRALFEVQRTLSFEAAAERTLLRWHEARPSDVRPVLELASRWAGAGAARRALASIEQVAQVRPGDLQLARYGAWLGRMLGDPDVHATWIERQHASDPQSADALRDQQVTAALRGDGDDMLRLAGRIATHPRTGPSALRTATETMLREGNEEAALAAWGAAVAAGESSHQMHAVFSRLAGHERPEPIAALDEQAAKLVDEFRPTDREQTAPSTLVADRMIVELLPDGAQIRETHQVRRINDPRGVEQHQNADTAARADELLVLRTVLPDGGRFVPHRVEGGYSMPRLAPGALIEERHVERVAAPGADPLRSTTFFFRSDAEPFVLSELVLLLPKDARGTLRTRNFDGEREEVGLGDGRRMLRFRARDQARLPEERFRPPDLELLPVVTWGEDGAGAAAVRDDLAQLRSLSMPDALIARKAAELMAGLEEPAARLAAIHEFVHREIPSSRGNADPTSVLLLGRGPRLFLAAALARAAGIELEIGLCAAQSPELAEEPSPLFAGEDRWNVPCVRAQVPGRDPVWMFFDDPRHVALGTIPGTRFGASVLLAGPHGPVTARLPAGDAAARLGFRVRGTAVLGASGDIELDAIATLSGNNGLGAADQVRQREENVQKVIARQLGGQLFKGWTQREVELTGIARPGEPLGVHAKIGKGRVLKNVGERILLPLPLVESRHLQTLGDRAERTLPYRLTDLFSDSWEVEVDPGEAYRIVGTPEPVHIWHELIEFHLTFERRGDHVVVRREIVRKPGQLPAARFGEWLELLQGMDRAEAATIEVKAR